jgi:hypothetical protein
VHDWMGWGGGHHFHFCRSSTYHTVGAEYDFKLIIKLTYSYYGVYFPKIIHTHRLLLLLGCLVCVYHKVHTEWQLPLSGVHSIMMEKLARPGEGGKCTLPLPLYLPSRAKLRCMTKLRWQIHSPYYHSTPICALWCILKAAFTVSLFKYNVQNCSIFFFPYVGPLK